MQQRGSNPRGTTAASAAGAPSSQLPPGAKSPRSAVSTSAKVALFALLLLLVGFAAGALPECWLIDFTGSCTAAVGATRKQQHHQQQKGPMVAASACGTRASQQELLDPIGVDVIARVYESGLVPSCAPSSSAATLLPPCLTLRCDFINVSDDTVVVKFMAADGSIRLATRPPLHEAERFIVTPLYEPCAAATVGSGDAKRSCLFRTHTHDNQEGTNSGSIASNDEQCAAYACTARIRNVTAAISRIRRDRVAKRHADAATKAPTPPPSADEEGEQHLPRGAPKFLSSLPHQVQLEYLQSLNNVGKISDVVDRSTHVAPLASRVVLPGALAACLDPRFPTRMPLVLLPLAPPPLREATAMTSKHGGVASPDLLTCYGATDIVCDTLRREGEWEPNILKTVVQMLDDAKAFRVDTLRSALVKFVNNQTRQRRADVTKIVDGALARADAFANFGVEYLDIGANVGAFLMLVHRAGYPVTAFEALPYNMQLLSTTLCVNGLRRVQPRHDGASFTDATAVLNRVTSDAVSSVEGTPSVTVHYTALGREKDLRCVMMSEDLNFGDTWISCNATHVDSTAEFPFQKYRRRGFVNMTRLDSFTATAMTHETTHRRRVTERVLQDLVAQFPDAPFALTPVDQLAARLIPDTRFWLKDYVAKIDVEGHEVPVMEGALALLQDPQRRPIAVVSEVWLSLNMTRYHELMSAASYVGWSMGFRTKITNKRTLERYNDMRGGQDTIVWIQSAWDGLLSKRLFPVDQWSGV